MTHTSCGRGEKADRYATFATACRRDPPFFRGGTRPDTVVFPAGESVGRGDTRVKQSAYTQVLDQLSTYRRRERNLHESIAIGRSIGSRIGRVATTDVDTLSMSQESAERCHLGTVVTGAKQMHLCNSHSQSSDHGIALGSFSTRGRNGVAMSSRIERPSLD